MARTGTDLALLVGALTIATVLAELLGAPNMGTALTFGTLAFTAALLWVLVPHDGAETRARERTSGASRSR